MYQEYKHVRESMTNLLHAQAAQYIPKKDVAAYFIPEELISLYRRFLVQEYNTRHKQPPNTAIDNRVGTHICIARYSRLVPI